MKLEKAIEYMKAEASTLDPALLSREVGSFAIDSREVKAGDVFFALSQPEYRNNGFNGDFADSTRFVRTALDQGAVAVVVRKDRFKEHQLEDLKGKAIFSEDVIRALQLLAHGTYLEWNKPIVAITGSAGKTTAKELVAHVLSSGGLKTLRNIKNYNNGLGHPLTVLRLAAEKDYDAAVLEMGMSTPMHEIRRLCEITPPDVAVVLNVLPVHVEHLGSIENVAKAKAEIIEGMKPGGTAVLNADDPRVAAMEELSRGKTITYGFNQSADISASDIQSQDLGNTVFKLHWKDAQALVHFPLNGKHNISNALAASAVGVAFGMSIDDIAAALSSVEGPSQRGVVLKFAEGFTVIDDSYNSNPSALLSMVEMVVGQAGFERKIIVAGEMLELGSGEGELHRDTGRKIAQSGADMLIGVRGLGSELVAGAVEAGFGDAMFATDSDQAAELVCGMVRTGDLILVKGSRGVKTEKIISRLLDEFELEQTVSRQK